jgi:hypothetical protein
VTVLYYKCYLQVVFFSMDLSSPFQPIHAMDTARRSSVRRVCDTFFPPFSVYLLWLREREREKEGERERERESEGERERERERERESEGEREREREGRERARDERGQSSLSVSHATYRRGSSFNDAEFETR